MAPAGTNRRDRPVLNPIVRLAPGVSRAGCRRAAARLLPGRRRENPASFPAQGFTTRLQNYLDVTVASGDMRTTLRLLLGAVGFLLLIACANVANLQLARGTARAREMAVRTSIGAGRRRLVRQLLTESVVLSVIGGAAGVLFAYAAVNTIVAMMPEFYVPNEARVSINTPVLLFSVAVSVLTGVLFGLVPALQHSRPDVVDALKTARGSGGAAGRPHAQPPRRRRGGARRGAARERGPDRANVPRPAADGCGMPRATCSWSACRCRRRSTPRSSNGTFLRAAVERVSACRVWRRPPSAMEERRLGAPSRCSRFRESRPRSSGG